MTRTPLPSLGDRLEFRLVVAEKNFIVLALLQGHFKVMCCCRCCGSVSTLFVWVFSNDGRKEERKEGKKEEGRMDGLGMGGLRLRTYHDFWSSSTSMEKCRYRSWGH